MSITLNQTRTDGGEFTSLAEVREAILAAAREAQAADRHDTLDIAIPNGWYGITEPFVLSAKENPELNFVDITLRGEYERLAVIHSLALIPEAGFTPVKGKPYFKYQFAKDENGKYPLFHDLFVGGVRAESAVSATWRNPLHFTKEERAGEAKVKGFYAPIEIAEQLDRGTLGTTELMLYIEWEFAVLHVTGADLSDTKEVDGKTYALIKVKTDELDFLATACHPSLNVGQREAFFQNTPAFLSKPGTYAYDYKRGTLYVVPNSRDGSMKGVKVQYPRLNNLFKLEGLKNFTLRGITFTATTSTQICKSIYYSGQANTLYNAKKFDDCARGRLQHAAVVTASMRNFTVENCSFRDLGGNGVLITNDTTLLNVRGNVFKNIAMSALSVGNPTTAWEDPINRNIAITIENNYFNHIAYDYPSALCMYVGMADGLTIHRNTVDGCGYSAISCGWGWSYVKYELGEKVNVRDADIAYNYFKNFMDVLRDGAAIYVVGSNSVRTNSRRFNVMHDNYATLDERRDGSKRGYYCDGSTTNWEVKHSVIINCALPLFSQFHWPPAGTYHNTLHDVYSTTAIDPGNHAPYRDTILGENYVVTEGEEALYEKYPVAREIRDAAGCDPDLIKLK